MPTIAITKFVRCVSRAVLDAYVSSHAPKFAVSFSWPKSPDAEVANDNTPFLKALDKMDAIELEKLHHNAERINDMTTELGQSALQEVAPDPKKFHALINAHDKAAWIFVNHPQLFDRAEEIHCADYSRATRMWDAFFGPTGQTISRNSIYKFKAQLQKNFGENTKIKIEYYQRQKTDDHGEVSVLEQIVIYREGAPDTHLVFKDAASDIIVAKVWRPLQELIISYEPENGIIEVVARTKEQREDIVKAFSAVVLDTEIKGERMPYRQYILSSLITDRVFPTDMNDGIDDVKVLMVKLRSFNGSGSVTLEIPRKHEKPIHQQAADWFAENDPFQGAFAIQEAKLAIHFSPLPGEQRGKVLTIKIAVPNRCDLKSRTEQERLIGDKYLATWGLIKTE